MVQKINREILFDGKVSAVTPKSAEQKAQAECSTLANATANNDIFDRLEITCEPFCSK